MKDLVANNYLIFASLIGLLVLMQFDRTLSRNKTQLLKTISITIICILIFEILDAYYSGFDHLVIGRVITSAAGYILRPFVILLFIAIVNRRKKTSKILYGMLLVEALIVVTSQFTHLGVYFDAENYFHRGPLGLLPLVLSLVYMVIMVVCSISNQIKVDMVETIAISYMELMCISATLLESFRGYKFLLINAMSFSVILYYTYLNVQLNKHDELTGVLNRRSFFYEVEYKKNTTMAIISCDMNSLKRINDEQGHTAGDQAICAMSEAICAAKEKGFKVYRVGGDEFVIIGFKKTAQQVERYIRRANRNMEKTPFTAAFGYAIYQPGDNFERIYSLSDKMMYENKRKAKDSRG